MLTSSLYRKGSAYPSTHGFYVRDGNAWTPKVFKIMAKSSKKIPTGKYVACVWGPVSDFGNGLCISVLGPLGLGNGRLLLRVIQAAHFNRLGESQGVSGIMGRTALSVNLLKIHWLPIEAP